MATLNLVLLTYTGNKRIARCRRWAPADRCMVEDAAHGCVAARAGAGIYALVAHAGTVARALGAHYALRPAAGGGRVAARAARARAHGAVSDH